MNTGIRAAACLAAAAVVGSPGAAEAGENVSTTSSVLTFINVNGGIDDGCFSGEFELNISVQTADTTGSAQVTTTDADIFFDVLDTCTGIVTAGSVFQATFDPSAFDVSNQGATFNASFAVPFCSSGCKTVVVDVTGTPTSGSSKQVSTSQAVSSDGTRTTTHIMDTTQNTSFSGSLTIDSQEIALGATPGQTGTDSIDIMTIPPP